MKKLFLGIIGLVVAANAFALTADQKYLLNNKAGRVPFDIQLGTLLDGGAFIGLSSGKILLGNSSGVSAQVTPSGDVTISNTGVTAIGAGKVTEAMLNPLGVTQLNAQRIAVAVYDFAVQGGTQAAFNLGVALPAKSTIIRSWIYTKTQLVGASSQMAISCETANNIKTATDLTGNAAGSYVEGASTGAASAFKDIVSACNITATISVANLTAGKLDIYVQYVVHE
jgi:hypothetical protein